MITESLPIYKSCLEMIGQLIDCTNNFSRIFRYTFGEDMIKRGINMLGHVQAANMSTGGDICQHIDNFIVEFNTIRSMIRICCERNEIGNKKMAQLAIVVESIGKQATGWRQKQQEKYETTIPKEVNNTAEPF